MLGGGRWLPRQLLGGLGVVDGVQRRSDVVGLGLQEAGQPASLVAEAHGEHLGQGLHQPGVRLCKTSAINLLQPMYPMLGIKAAN